MRKWPAGLSRNAFTDSSTASKLSSKGRSCTRSRSPASVTATLRVVRLINRTPSRSSSERRLSLKEERDTPSCLAALAKLACSAIATKAFISAMLAFFIVRNLRPSRLDNAGLSNRHQRRTLLGQLAALRGLERGSFLSGDDGHEYGLPVSPRARRAALGAGTAHHCCARARRARDGENSEHRSDET